MSTGTGGGDADWIPVSERLPEFPPDQPSYRNFIGCIVCTTNRIVLYMEWRRNPYAKTEKGKAARWTWLEKNSPWEITHWQPLPEPPAASKVGPQDKAEAE